MIKTEIQSYYYKNRFPIYLKYCPYQSFAYGVNGIKFIYILHYRLNFSNNLVYNNLIFIISIVFLPTAIITVLAFAQSEEKGINQTLLQDINKSTNQTIQNTTQSANGTGEAIPIQKNVTDLGANITEGAKDLLGNMGEGIQNLSSGNLSLIL